MKTVMQRIFLLGLFLTCSSPVFALPRDVVDRVKKVTAYVEIPHGRDGMSSGTAFCIDAKGLFVTNEHVVHGGHKFTVILNPGETDQRVVNARLVKVNAEMDLALLKLDEPGTLVPLQLGDVKNLYDTMELTAFGYPFGTMLATKQDAYPNISVTTGHVTALRKKDGQLEIIQLDAVLNPGNSGGPVLDDKGNVVGIAQSIIVATGINFAIPVSRLQKFLNDPANNTPDAPEQPSREPPPPTLNGPGVDPLHGKEWELTPYLKGTAPQIRDKLNGEMERLILKIKETKATIKKYDDDAVTDEKSAIEALRQSAEYKRAAAEKIKAEQDLEEARKDGSPDRKLEASSRFNKARFAVEKLEHDAVANSSSLSQDRHRSYEAQNDLKRYAEALTKATAWREELLDATRNGFMLKGPVRPGSKGTLPRITVAKIIDGSHMVVDYDLLTFDFDHPHPDKEGIKVFDAFKTKIKILVSGIDTTKMKQGDKTSLDHVYVIDGTRHSENQGTIYLASPSPSEADGLFDTIVPLRESLASVGK